MALWQIILVTIAAFIAVAIAIEMYLKRNQPRPPLAKQFLGDELFEEIEEKPELGMEAIDMDVIRASERGSKSAAALGARDMEFWTRRTRRLRKKHETEPTRQGRNQETKK